MKRFVLPVLAGAALLALVLAVTLLQKPPAPWEPSEPAQAAASTGEEPSDMVTRLLEEKKAELSLASPDWFFDVYPGPDGSLAVYGQKGVPHGTSCNLLYVGTDGQQTELAPLMPAHGFGAQFYLAPREIAFDESGERLTFITPVKEEVEGETREWGDTLCTFNTRTGEMETMQPISAALRSDEPPAPQEQSAPAEQPMLQEQPTLQESTPAQPWEAVCALGEGDPVGECVEVTFARAAQSGAVEVQAAQLPDARVSVFADEQGLRVVHEGTDPLPAEYAQAYEVLNTLGLPSVSDDGFVRENTREQREQAAALVRVTKNGEAVSGVLWWSQGNNHRDLNFTFDQPQELAEGDELTVSIGAGA